MPHRPLGPCPAPGCPNRKGTCPAHPSVRPPDTRPSATQRGYDVHWRRIRAQYLKAHPACVVCGVVEASNHADHIVAKANGGSDQWSNLETLCATHHSQKTATRDGGFGNAKVKSS